MKEFRLREWVAAGVVIGFAIVLVAPHVREAAKDTEQDACRRSMHLLAAAQELAYARGGGYGADPTELGSVSPVTQARNCPAARAVPVVNATVEGYRIVCPNNGVHGSIHDGALSWTASF